MHNFATGRDLRPRRKGELRGDPPTIEATYSATIWSINRPAFRVVDSEFQLGRRIRVEQFPGAGETLIVSDPVPITVADLITRYRRSLGRITLDGASALNLGERIPQGHRPASDLGPDRPALGGSSNKISCARLEANLRD